jgi:hypothetical protein
MKAILEVCLHVGKESLASGKRTFIMAGKTAM